MENSKEEDSVRQKGFALGIKPQFNEKGNFVNYILQTENFGVSDEVVITMIRNWLRAVEDKYYEMQFKTK